MQASKQRVCMYVGRHECPGNAVGHWRHGDQADCCQAGDSRRLPHGNLRGHAAREHCLCVEWRESGHGVLPAVAVTQVRFSEKLSLGQQRQLTQSLCPPFMSRNSGSELTTEAPVDCEDVLVLLLLCSGKVWQAHVGWQVRPAASLRSWPPSAGDASGAPWVLSLPEGRALALQGPQALDPERARQGRCAHGRWGSESSRGARQVPLLRRHRGGDGRLQRPGRGAAVRRRRPGARARPLQLLGR